MKIKIRKPQWFTEIGRKDNQEDYLWPQPDQVSDQCRVFLMCDGVGGQDSGEIASQTAATAIGTYITQHMAQDAVFTEDDFKAALAHGYAELDKVDTGAAKKMGTTMTCLVLHKGGALVAHIGDSRIYHVRPSLAKDGLSGIIYQTTDHSLVNDLLRAGEITEEEAVNFPQKNVITRAMQPNLERPYRADIYKISDVQSGDFFFLCCDGVLEQLTNEKLGLILSDSTTTDEEKIASIKAVCNGCTRDNYTCWLIPIDSCKVEQTDIVQDDEVSACVEVDDCTDETTTAPVRKTPPPVAHSQEPPRYQASASQKGGNIKIIAGIALVAVLALAAGFFLKDSIFPNDDGEGATAVKEQAEKKVDTENAQTAVETPDEGTEAKVNEEQEKPVADTPTEEKVNEDQEEKAEEQPKVDEESPQSETPEKAKKEEPESKTSADALRSVLKSKKQKNQPDKNGAGTN